MPEPVQRFSGIMEHGLHGAEDVLRGVALFQAPQDNTVYLLFGANVRREAVIEA
jgi:hypothetical protein